MMLSNGKTACRRIVLAAVALGTLGVSHAALAETIALTGANVVDLDGKAAIRDAVVVIEDDRIIAVGPADTTLAPADARKYRFRESGSFLA